MCMCVCVCVCVCACVCVCVCVCKCVCKYVCVRERESGNVRKIFFVSMRSSGQFINVIFFLGDDHKSVR